MTDASVSAPLPPRPVAGVLPLRMDHLTAAARLALRTAAIWLAVLAVGMALLAPIAVFIGDDSEPWPRLAPLALLGGCALTARASWRAASPDHSRSRAVAFASGLLVLVVSIGPAIAVLLPPTGLYGVDMYAAGSAAHLPESLVVVAPATLMVFGALAIWCGSGEGATTRRRTRLLAAVLLAILVPIATLGVVDAAHPACETGRTCIGSAAIAFDPPSGWSRIAPEKNDLYVAVAGDDHLRFALEDGAAVLRDAGRPVPTNVDDVATSVPGWFTNGFLSWTSEVSVDRVALPVGPSVRLAYVSSTSFIFTFYQTTISYWFFVRGHLIIAEYMQAWGEGSPDSVGPDPDDLRHLLESIRAL